MVACIINICDEARKITMFDSYSQIDDIRALYANGQISVRQVVLHFLSRIAKIDKCAGGLNSVLEINPDALFIADMLDKKLSGEGACNMPPLFGIPVLLKDNINTGDRMHTSAGSVALADNYAPRDAHIVKLLRAAGAVILGKVNMTEFANYMSTENMPSGYSSRGGQVINPYNAEITPSGSSSGSGVSVAAGLCTVSIGTETSGSILSPAVYNGIVGIKPTLGLVGRSGIIPISSSLDTAGPMARTVRDAALLLAAMAGRDPADPATHARNGGAHNYENGNGGGNSHNHSGGSGNGDRKIDYSHCFDSDCLAGVRIGINRIEKQGGEASVEKTEEKNAFANLCEVLEKSCAELIDNVNYDAEFRAINIMHYEFKACMNYYLSTLGCNSKVRTLNDIIQYNQANASVALKYGQGRLLESENKISGTFSEPEYIEYLLEREKTIADFDKTFDENGIDIMLCDSFNSLAPFTGFPGMTIPIGRRSDMLPIGSYWIAKRYDEAKLIKAAYAAERRLNLNLRPAIAADGR